MIPGVIAAASSLSNGAFNPGPAVLKLDFENGIYRLNGVDYPLDDLVMGSPALDSGGLVLEEIVSPGPQYNLTQRVLDALNEGAAWTIRCEMTPEGTGTSIYWPYTFANFDAETYLPLYLALNTQFSNSSIQTTFWVDEIDTTVTSSFGAPVNQRDAVISRVSETGNAVSVNGVNTQSWSLASPPTPLAWTYARLGGFDDFGPNSMTGHIHKFEVWNQAFTDGQINQMSAL